VCILKEYFVYSVESIVNHSVMFLEKLTICHMSTFYMIIELLSVIICVTVVWVIVDMDILHMMNGAVA
jgi:hypothetical protein